MSQRSAEWRDSIQQKQFLDVITRDEAMARFRQHLHLKPVGIEIVLLTQALQRVLARDVVSPLDVPGFDRSNVDGFAVQSADTSGAMEESPRFLSINDEVLSPGVCPQTGVGPGQATPIATGGMIPRGADAVVMIEHTEVVLAGAVAKLRVERATAAGQNISFAGSDIARGETVLRAGQRMTSREIGVLAALGMSEVGVWARPRVAVISTGNEIIAPGQPLPLGSVYDSNAAIVGASVVELGCEAVYLGTVRDDVDHLRTILQAALQCDAVILSGGTSKGAGDLSYQVVNELTKPGIVAHGVALKPGKPICLAVTSGKPVVVLPGFPTSAIFTFQEFVAPVLRELAGQPRESRQTVRAKLPLRVHSEKGRTEYLLVSLVTEPVSEFSKASNADNLASPLAFPNGAKDAVLDRGIGHTPFIAWPMGKGSGSVTTFSLADGFITIDQHTEILDAGSEVEVKLLGQNLAPADLVVIGSHCVGLDYLLSELRQRGFSSKVLHVGSLGGAAAAKRGECDLAGVHVMDADTGTYNEHLLTSAVTLERGYRRLQGIVFRADDNRFAGKSLNEAIGLVTDLRSADSLTMVNRNPGSGTRILIDQLLNGLRPAGYSVQTKSHNAVATAVSQGRADWGLAIETVAREYGLGFIALQDEHYDFLIPSTRRSRPAVQAFVTLLSDTIIRDRLRQLGFRMHDEA